MKEKEWFREPHKLYNYLRGHKHSWRDISVGLTSAYICETCFLQDTTIGYKMHWYRYAPWLKDFNPNDPNHASI